MPGSASCAIPLQTRIKHDLWLLLHPLQSGNVQEGIKQKSAVKKGRQASFLDLNLKHAGRASI